MKIKVNPGYVLLILIAVIFAFGPLFLNYRRKIVFTQVEKNWVSVKLPGKVTDVNIPSHDFKFIAAIDNYRSAIVALIPAGEKSDIDKAFKSGPVEIMAFLNKNILSESLYDPQCNIDPESKSYIISGRRNSDKWFASGRLWLKNSDPSAAVLIMVFADNKNDSIYAMGEIFNSIKLN